MTHTPIQPYHSLSNFVISHGLILPRPHATWRLLRAPCVGRINGLDRPFSGLAVATNGIIVAILTSAGNILFGHLQWFIKDDLNAESDLDAAWESANEVSLAKMKGMVKMMELFEECL